MIKAKIVSGALQGAEIRPDALNQLDIIAAGVATALVDEVHASLECRSPKSHKTIQEQDIQAAVLKLFGEQLGMSLVEHALNVRHRG